MSDGRLIKRYANRKLYDTANSRYVTLEEIAALIHAGEDVRIIDNQSKADLTAVTLAQILVEEEKRGDKRTGPMPALRHLIQRRIAEPVHQIRTSVEESVTRLLKPGTAAPESVAPTARPPEEPRGPLEELSRRLDERIKQLVPGLEPADKRRDVEGSTDASTRFYTGSRAPSPRPPERSTDPMARLQQQIAALGARLERIEAHLGLTPADEP